jgi:uncharacterized protein (DUF3084 family)
MLIRQKDNKISEVRIELAAKTNAVAQLESRLIEISRQAAIERNKVNRLERDYKEQVRLYGQIETFEGEKEALEAK